MLEKRWQKTSVKTRERFEPFSKCAKREFWESLHNSLKKQIINQAEVFIEYQYPTLLAVRYMDFTRNGNRTEFKSIYNERRSALGSLVMAECLENKDRYLDDIINGIYAICEESTWVVPAHNNLFQDGKHLPLPHNFEIGLDLFAAETGELLACTYYLLKEKLDLVSPQICNRIEKEIKCRIIEPFMMYEHYWWMGFGQREANNWNPWITSNVLMTSMIIERDDNKRLSLVKKSLRVLDSFISVYDDDGGCDEGAGYWLRAAGSLFDALEVLYLLSDGQLDVYDHGKIRAMGQYIYKMQISGKDYINFADCQAKLEVPATLIYRYGQRIQCQDMVRHGLAAFKEQNYHIMYYPWFSAFRHLHAFEVYNEMYEQKSQFVYEKDFVMKSVQVMAARMEHGSTSGLFLAAKGGNNEESHNHNDVGHFIVYKNGHPMIIDVGVGEYTRKTFSEERYDIWNMQSLYHNLPCINGFQQSPGKSFRSQLLRYSCEDNQTCFELEIGGAYPENAKILNYLRKWMFDRNCHQIVIEDSYELSEMIRPISWSIMTAVKPVNIPNGFQLHQNDTVLTCELNLKDRDVAIEGIELKDEMLKAVWGRKIYRILVTNKFSRSQEQLVVKIY